MALRPLFATLLLSGFIAISLAACADTEPGPGAPTAPPGEFQDPADADALGTVDDPIEGSDEDLKP